MSAWTGAGRHGTARRHPATPDGARLRTGPTGQAGPVGLLEEQDRAREPDLVPVRMAG